MLFSVIIPAFNRMPFLPSTLASVRAQRFTDFETIIVDDGSTDGTREYLRTLDHIRLVEQPRGGPGAARNAGAVVARGDHLAFLDSDDVWLPWTLSVMAQVIAERGPAMIAGRYVDVASDAAAAGIGEQSLEYQYFDDYLRSSRHPVSTGAGTLVIARHAFANSGGFATRPANMEDHDLALRLGTAPGFVSISNPVTIAWRRHGATETADLSKSIAGANVLVSAERSGAYPGGAARADERRRIITRHVRPIAMECLRMGRRRDGHRLYRSTFGWNAGAGHWAYLAAFPVLSAWSSVRRAA